MQHQNMKTRRTETSKASQNKSGYHGFWKGETGVAAIEFALIAPLMMTLMLGALEITQSVWADGKVEKATSTIGDLVARSSAMSDLELTGIGYAGPLILQPNPANDLNFTVTSIVGCRKDPSDAASDLTYVVLWSRSWQGGSLQNSPHSIDTQFSRQPGDLRVADGDTLIVTEGSYTYTPTITRNIGTTVTMDGFAFHQPRDQSTRIGYAGRDSSKTCNDYRTDGTVPT